MQSRETYTGPVVTIQVDDVTAALRNVESHGGKAIVKRTEMGQYGPYGYFKDPEGNLMGLFEQPKMSR